MLKFDEKKLVDRINGALKLRPQVEEVVDRLWDSGLRNICFMGIGGTYASALDAVTAMLESRRYTASTPPSTTPPAITVWGKARWW